MAENRLDVLFSGSVQGVGFRFTAERYANDYGVKGYVKNLANGKVGLVAEGEEKTLQKLLDAIVEDMGNVIDKYHADWFQATGEFSRFEIRFY